VALPPKPPPRSSLANGSPPANEDALSKSRREKDELEREVQSTEEELEALRARYEQYFLGIERREPNRWRDEIRKRVMKLKGAFTRNTGLKFRIQSLHARYLSYDRLWLRSGREKEEGTYRRDLFKARLRRGGDAAGVKRPEAEAARVAEAEQKVAPIAKSTAGEETPAAARADSGGSPRAEAARPSTPAAPTPKAAPSRPPAPGAGAMSEVQMRALYNAYLAAKMTCREDVSKLTYDAVARTVTKQIPELMTRYKAKTVEFKVEVKDGKAILKAIPKV
jgi:hypothetical protein